MLTEEKSQLEEKNDNSTGNTISIASYSVYFSLEENEKLKAKVVDDDVVIAKLTKEKLQLKKELQSLKEREPVKDIGIQFDYIVPSMGKRFILHIDNYNAMHCYKLTFVIIGLTPSTHKYFIV